MSAQKRATVRKPRKRSAGTAARAKKRSPKRPRTAAYSQALAALEGPERNVTIEFDEGSVTLTNLEKVLWPATATLPAYSRRDHMRYLLRVADYMLPHVQDRPLTLIRQPEGVAGRRFVQFH